MYQTISKGQFRDAFHECGRGEQFSYEGLGALYEYLEDLESEIEGERIELDVIALCCEYTEYENWAEFVKNYGDKVEDLEELMNHTTVITTDGDNFKIQDF